MNEQSFIVNNRLNWQKLEHTLKKLQAKGYASFDSNELEDFMSTYHLTCSHLSFSRTHFGTSSTTQYLNQLVASAHSYIYISKTSRISKFFLFFLVGFPKMLRENITFFLVSTGLFVFAIIGSFVFTMISPENAGAFLPQDILDSINFEGNTSASLQNAMISSEILTNNIKVGLFAFALGITLGIGTIWILLTNGVMLGSLGGLAVHNDASWQFWSLILPHGVIELFSIFVCGAAGLILGYSLLHPGQYKRTDSLIINGKKAILLVLGTIPLFIIAGIIEGFFTPSAASIPVKYIVSFITLLFIVFYMIVGNHFAKKLSATHNA